MKKSGYLSAVLFITAVLSLTTAFGQTPAPAVTSNPTPVTKPNAMQIHLRINMEYAQVRQCRKNKTISHDDARNLYNNLRSVSNQKNILLKRDYSRDLSDSQTAQLNDTLDEIQKTITAAGGTPATRYNHQ